MKKIRTVIILALIFCLIPCCAALAKTGKVTASSLNIRKTADSDSRVVGTLKEGASVTIKDSTGSWYKITANGKTGYVYKKYIKVTDSSGSSDSKKNSSKSTKDSKAKSSASSDGTCGPGDSGSAVRKVQKRLKKLGYYTGSIDGDYGNGTKTAVKNFQKRNGLNANGKVNSKTLAKLNSSGAKKATASDAADSGSAKTERLNWFNGGSSKIPKGATFKVKDIKTGKVFTVKRWSGGNHIDAEPATASDTSTMKSIYGHWSWKRRAVLVKYNGHVYAASMNGMPHGTQTISRNNFDGHFCIHFYGSKTHGSKKVDAMHQSCVAEAMKHTW
ncbi:MAG: peptidoglycan-binding protein [Clostridiales bacterium]|nr:peptidoglycan-binding protein [Clostridiales bacterium]